MEGHKTIAIVIVIVFQLARRWCVMSKGILGVGSGLERSDGGSAGRDLVDKEVLLKDVRVVD